MEGVENKSLSIGQGEALIRRLLIAKDHLAANAAGIPAESAVLQTILQFLLEILPDVINYLVEDVRKGDVGTNVGTGPLGDSYADGGTTTDTVVQEAKENVDAMA